MLTNAGPGWPFDNKSEPDNVSVDTVTIPYHCAAGKDLQNVDALMQSFKSFVIYFEL